MKSSLLALAGLAVVGLAGTALAQVDADAGRDYTVTPADGAWMICAADFRGESATKQAHDLVVEIRGRYHLPAFVFDRTAEERRRQQAEIEQQRQELTQMLGDRGVRPEDVSRMIRYTRIDPECVVLVGSYRDMESARKALDQIRKLKPESVPAKRVFISTSNSPVFGNDQFWGGHRSDHVGEIGDNHADQAVQHDVNPFTTAFVVHNPTVPIDHRQDDADEAKALRNLNSEESLSVYRCRKPWTLVVATYQGPAVVAQDRDTKSMWDRVFGGHNDRLGAAAQNAHNLAEALRKLNYEAYVFHTRYRSVVTVGGFDSRNDPGMQTMHEMLMTRLQKDPRVAMPFLQQVMPMEVPH
jgi:hypothetical protein